MKIIFYFLFVSILFSCNADDEFEEYQIKKKRRLVIAYIVGDNDLNSYAIDFVNTLEKGVKDIDKNEKLIAYVDLLYESPFILEIQYDTTEGIKSPLIKRYDEWNSLNPDIMNSVFQDIRQMYSKVNYSSMGLVYWSHGSSWLPNSDILYQRYSSFPSNIIASFGHDYNDNMDSDSIFELQISLFQKALEGYYFDYILFDVCFMAGVEVAYELRNHSDYLIAAPTEVLADATPFLKITQELFVENFNPSNVARGFENYWSSRSGVYKTGSISVIDLSQMDNLGNTVAKFLTSTQITQMPPIDSVQEFSRNNEKIFFDFKDLFNQLSSKNEVPMNEIGKALGETVIYSSSSDYSINELEIKNIVV